MIEVQTTDLDAGSYSDCGSINLSFSPNSVVQSVVFDCNDIHSNTVWLYATDENGNQNSCQTNIWIRNEQEICKPNLACLSMGSLNITENKILINNFLYINNGELIINPTFYNDLFLSTDTQFDDNDILVERFSRNLLAAYAVDDFNTQIDISSLSSILPYDTYYIGINLDIDNRIDEHSETDNTCFWVNSQLVISCDNFSADVFSVTSNEAQFYINMFVGIPQYEFRVRTANTSIWTTYIYTEEESITLANLIADNEYEFQMRIYCQDTWTDWSIPQYFNTLSCFSGSIQEVNTRLIPDGYGIELESVISIDAYETNAVISNVSDVQAISLNIEHSWMRDLEVKLTCPNSTSIVLHDHPGNFGSGIYLGEPVLSDGNSPEIGIGYTYRWTKYNGGLTWIEWANVNNESGFETLPMGDYRPFESLDLLVGCPLNGNWTLSVEDYWGQDNGHFFSWGIDFQDFEPFLTQQLTDKHAIEGDIVIFSIDSLGDNFVYQWEESTDGETFYPLFNQFQSTLTINDVSLEQNENQYRCILTKDCGEIVTESSTLYVSSPLSLELITFNAEIVEHEVYLTWQTQFEIDFAHFIIQRSLDGNNWATIGKRTPNSSQEYQFIDNLKNFKFSENQVYYKLKLVELSEKVTYSSVRSVQFPNSEITWQIYPNPTNGKINIANNEVALNNWGVGKLFNLQGKVLDTFSFSSSIENNLIIYQLDLSYLPKGLYLLQLNTKNGYFTKRIVLE